MGVSGGGWRRDEEEEGETGRERETHRKRERQEETAVEEKKTKACRKVKGLTNSECRSLEIPCTLADCWMTLSRSSARGREWHTAPLWAQMGALPALSGTSKHTITRIANHPAD